MNGWFVTWINRVEFMNATRESSPVYVRVCTCVLWLGLAQPHCRSKCIYLVESVDLCLMSVAAV